MKTLSHADAFEVLCLQVADEGRGPVLFGDAVQRARKAGRPFMVGEEFPSVYLEFPLIGEPFLDVTVLYDTIPPGTRVDSPAAAGSDRVLDWYAETCNQVEAVCFGFELDVKDPSEPVAALHFQPRRHTDLVHPFCEAVGEPEKAALYLGLDERMPKGWGLSFFGMFRGRPGSPLRVCGYLSVEESRACVENPRRLTEVFDAIGFTAYSEAMLQQVVAYMATAPGELDFQFDVYPDGSLGDVFAIDAQFEIAQPSQVEESFADGPAARVMELLEGWGVADERWKLAAGATFARSIPVALDDGSMGRFCFTVHPQWVKARWNKGVLQQAKLYYLGKAKLIDDPS